MVFLLGGQTYQTQFKISGVYINGLWNEGKAVFSLQRKSEKIIAVKPYSPSGEMYLHTMMTVQYYAY